MSIQFLFDLFCCVYIFWLSRFVHTIINYSNTFLLLHWLIFEEKSQQQQKSKIKLLCCLVAVVGLFDSILFVYLIIVSVRFGGAHTKTCINLFLSIVYRTYNINSNMIIIGWTHYIKLVFAFFASVVCYARHFCLLLCCSLFIFMSSFVSQKKRMNCACFFCCWNGFQSAVWFIKRLEKELNCIYVTVA